MGKQPWSMLNCRKGALLAVILAAAMIGNMALAAQSGGSNGVPVLQYTVGDSPLQVNLTSTQTLDWIHWGRISASEPDRKNGNSPLISDYSPFNGVQPSPNSGNITVSWDDGRPQARGFILRRQATRAPTICSLKGYTLII